MFAFLALTAASVKEADSLFALLADKWKGAAIDEARASDLIDELVSQPRAFDANNLGGGLWLSLLTRGPTPRWARNAQLLGGLLRNRVGQTYDPDASRVENYGELLGGALAFQAEGTFSLPEVVVSSCPVDIPVDIQSGGILVFGRRFDLGIKGPGLVRVRYIDDRLRIFESPNDSPDNWEEAGLLAVQVRETALPFSD